MTHDGTSAAQHSNNSNSYSAALKSEHLDDPTSVMAASPLELDRDMMGMLTTNWSVNNGPPRAPVANWGFEPTAAEAQALYDSDALMPVPETNQQTLPGSMMPTSTGMMELGMSNNSTMHVQTSLGPANGPSMDPFAGMDNGFALPYQDCAALPVSDFPLYDPASGMYMPASNAGMNQYAGSQATTNQLGDDTAPFFANPAMMSVGPSSSFQGGMGSSNGSTLFNEVAQPPAAALAAMNGFSLPDMTAMKDESDANSDWNGSSSGFSNVSSSPLPSGVGTPSSVGATTPTTGAKTPGKDGTAPKKPKRIRRLCSVAGCGKRARSQDLCIAHGGGRRCMVEGCEKSSQGGNMCIKHGGGKRCKHPGCDKAAQTNSLCKAHGGGPRCQFAGCTKSSQGGGFCRAHGGGKRCAAEGCNKGTQRGDFCALHGGSRFCEVQGCMRNDRGGGFCAHHGGGKRCSIANCNRSYRRNGLCSTHLRLLGQGAGGKGAASVPTAPPATVAVTTAIPVTIAGVTSV